MRGSIRPVTINQIHARITVTVSLYALGSLGSLGVLSALGSSTRALNAY